MKRPNIKCIGLLVLSAFAMGAMGDCSSTGSRVDSAIVRDATSKVEQEGMFSSICKTDDNGVFSVKAAKPFAGKDLAGYETVADEPEEEYQVVYDLSASSEDGAVTLNIRFNDSGEEIIDPFIGEPMTNGEGEEDVLFTIYGEHVMMSEFVEAASQNEECGWFSNLASKIKKAVEDKAGTIAHKTLNAAMAACVIVEPAARLFALTHNDITRTVYAVYRTARQTVYVTNYVSNSKQTQPSGYVYAQSEYGSWWLDTAHYNDVGCEVIAGYNMAYAKNKGLNLADVGYAYSTLGIEIGIAFGHFGSNPYQISYFLVVEGIRYHKSFTYRDFESRMNDGKNYYVIMSAWTGTQCDTNTPLHTFFVDKDTSRSNRFKAYNRNCYDTSHSGTDRNSPKDLCYSSDPSDTFVVAYFVEK